MDRDRKSIVLYCSADRAPDSPWIIWQMFGLRSDRVRTDLFIIRSKIGQGWLKDEPYTGILYTTVFCEETKHLYHVLGFHDDLGTSLVFVYDPKLCKRLTEKIKASLICWVKGSFYSVERDWNKRKRREIVLF